MIFCDIFKFSVKMKIKVICKTFALPRGRKSFANHFDFQFDGKFCQIDGKLSYCKTISVNLTNFFVKPRRNGAKLMKFHQHNYNSE